MKLKIVGPPGCGKTTKLMELLESELKQGTKPDRIAFLTFTRAAREEALHRTGKTENELPYLRTIHAICYRQLFTTQNEVVKPKNLRAFGDYLGVKLNANNIDPWVEEFERTHQPDTDSDLLLQVNHCGRHRGILLKEALTQSSLKIDYKYAVWFTKAYKQWKKSNGLLDYTDLLIQYLERGKPLDIDVIFVDEAQDLSVLQWEVVEKLGGRAKRQYIAGDDDQAIFHWAGADSSAFQDLVVDKTEILGQSYRLSKSVHAAAQKISARIHNRIDKDYLPTASKGEVTNIGYFSSADFSEKTFILFRHHYRGMEINHQLKESGIPYIGWGTPLGNIEVRKSLQAWYKLFKKGEISQLEAKKLTKYADEDELHFNFKKRLNEGKTFVPQDIFIRVPTWKDWKTVLSKLPGKDIIETCVKNAGFLATAKPNTEVLSIHQSKGREAHTVILDTEISRVTYQEMLKNSDDEHRVWYVAVSRAQERVLTLMFEGHYSYKIE
jgi:superfamily I DNA/RNA helicase